MKALLTSIAAVVVLSSTPALRAVDNDFVNEDILADEQFTQQLNQLTPSENQFGKMEKDASGILMHGGAAYIVQKLGQQLTLPDGTAVQPDGSILAPDGTQKSLGSGQMLSLDGGVKIAPFTGGQAPSGKLPSAPLSTDSNTNPSNTQSTPPLTSSPGTQDAQAIEKALATPEDESQD